MNKCLQCSRVLAESASFCPFCGTTQSLTLEESDDRASERPTKRGFATGEIEKRQDISQEDTQANYVIDEVTAPAQTSDDLAPVVEQSPFSAITEDVLTGDTLAQQETNDVSPDYMANLGSSTQALEVTPEMLDAMDKQVARMHEDAASTSPGVDLAPSVTEEVGATITEKSVQEMETLQPQVSMTPRASNDAVKAPLPQQNASTHDTKREQSQKGRVETPFDGLLNYVLENKWSIPLGIFGLLVLLILADLLR